MNIFSHPESDFLIHIISNSNAKRNHNLVFFLAKPLYLELNQTLYSNFLVWSIPANGLKRKECFKNPKTVQNVSEKSEKKKLAKEDQLEVWCTMLFMFTACLIPSHIYELKHWAHWYLRVSPLAYICICDQAIYRFDRYSTKK